MTNLRLCAIGSLLAAGCLASVEEPSEPSEPSTGSVEQAVEPGCSPPPLHYCEPYSASATYASPGFPWEPAMFSCWYRADAELQIGCLMNLGGCCGGGGVNDHNHTHTTDWSNGMWSCTGTIGLKKNCTPGSNIPECERACN